MVAVTRTDRDVKDKEWSIVDYTLLQPQPDIHVDENGKFG